MSKIIEPSQDFCEGFIAFVRQNYGEDEFPMATAANAYFQERYDTSDKWTDPKNITGFVKRNSEEGNIFQFIEEKVAITTKKKSKHYRLID